MRKVFLLFLIFLSAACHVFAQDILDAAEKGDLDEVKRLVNQGVDINTTKGSNAYHYSALHIAANKGHLELAEWLVADGADINLSCEWCTPLHIAARQGHLEIAKLLISSGVKINEKTPDGTPLHEAASAGNTEIVKLLLQNGADPNIIAVYDETPLTLAVAGSHDTIINLLIEAGADINARNVDGIGYVKKEPEIQSQRKYWFASERELTEKELQNYSKEELRIMRNEIFAAHGYIFKTDAMKTYFSSKKWYIPRHNNVDDKLTEVEKKNIDLIRKVENQLPLYVLSHKFTLSIKQYHL